MFAYNREKALAYARKWAMKRNPAYLNFDNLGGDCTSSKRTASWTGVPYLYNFLTGNKGVGPFAQEVDASAVEPGDIIQLGRADGTFYHSPVIVAISDDEIYVAAHTFDAYMRPLSTYEYDQARYLHILGVRNW